MPVMMYMMLTGITVNVNLFRCLMHMHRGKQLHRNKHTQQQPCKPLAFVSYPIHGCKIKN